MQILAERLEYQLEFHFELNSKPFSVNNYHYRDKRHKTAEARAWEEEIVSQLNELKELSAMADDWRLNGGYFELELIATYPPHIFYTQTGEVSGKTIDVSNFEKPLQDLIFKQMGLNDKLVTKLTSSKKAGTHHFLDVRLILR